LADLVVMVRDGQVDEQAEVHKLSLNVVLKFKLFKQEAGNCVVLVLLKDKNY
jgi:hypothetical protein